MAQSKSIILYAGLAVLAILGGYFYLSGDGRESSRVVKIGAILPLSGDIAFLGESLRDGLLLAQSEAVNTRYTYRLIFEDDQFDAKRAVSAAEKLITVDRVDVIVTMTSREANAVNPIAEARKVVQFSTASDPKAADGYFNFVHWTPASEEARVLVTELEKRGVGKIAVFSFNQQGTLVMREEVKKRLSSTNIILVADEIFNPGEKDFRSMIGKASALKPDIYLLLSFTPELEILAKQIKDAGIKAVLTSIESFELTDKPELFEGYWYVNAADPTSGFRKKYERKYSKAPNLGAANGYDIFNMIITAAERAHRVVAPRDIANQLYVIKDFPGALGSLTMNSEGVVISQPTVKIIKGGRPEALKE